jgi:hypothetical protein
LQASLGELELGTLDVPVGNYNPTKREFYLSLLLWEGIHLLNGATEFIPPRPHPPRPGEFAFIPKSFLIVWTLRICVRYLMFCSAPAALEKVD